MTFVRPKMFMVKKYVYDYSVSKERLTVKADEVKEKLICFMSQARGQQSKLNRYSSRLELLFYVGSKMYRFNRCEQ